MAERRLEERIFGGGKNSFFNKPFGTGKGSVSSMITPPSVGGATTAAATAVGEASKFSGKAKTAMDLMAEGEAKGEALTGTTVEGVGAGRADIRDRLKQILEGDSAGAAALRQDQQAQQRNLRAQQAMAGGGQMNVGQQQALKRQADIDTSKFISDEQRRTISDLGKEYRGLGGDIMKLSGQYGAIGQGSQPPAQAASGGLTVICTELNRQGLLPAELYKKDQEYGANLRKTDLKAFVGYFVWAKYVANWMSKSKVFTHIVKYPTLAWARHIAGEKNLAGSFIETVGLPICRTIGSYYILGESKYEN